MSTPRRANERSLVATLAAACFCALALGCASSTQKPASDISGDDGTSGGQSRTSVTIISGGGTERRTVTEAPPRDELWGGLDTPVAPPPQPGAPVSDAAPPPRAQSSPPPPLTPTGPTDGVMIEGKASRYQLQAVLEDNRASISACAPRSDGRPVGGTVVMSFRLGREGEPHSLQVVRSTFPEASVGECLKRALKGLRVPEARGGETTVIYPFHFVSGE